MARSYPIEEYLGPSRGTYIAHRAQRPYHVASGGAVTALATSLLQHGTADGVAMVRSAFDLDAEVGYEFRIVTDPAEFSAFGGSIYYDMPLQRHWNDIAEFNGRVAVVGLPCHMRALSALIRQGKGPSNVALTVSLFCGHNCTVGLMKTFLERNKISPPNVRGIRFVRTHIEGVVEVDTDDGKLHRLSFSAFNALRNLWLDSKRLCMSCDEHFGAAADVSVGDIFLPEYKSLGVKVSAIIVRTDAGERAWNNLVADGALTVQSVNAADVFRGQRRVVVASKDTMSRYRAARTLGYPAARPTDGRFRVRTYLTYLFLYAMNRYSQSPSGEHFARTVPKQIALAAVVAVKAIHSTLRR